MSQASDNIEGSSPKRMKKEPGGVKGKSVVVLLSSDVIRRDVYVFMPNTIEMAQLKKQGKGQFKTNVEISSQMTEMDIQTKLVEIFPILKHKRFYCAAAVDNRTRLDFHGEPRIWDGHSIKRKIKGNSALYILAEEEQQQHNDHIVRGLPEQSTLKRPHDQITTNKQSDFPVSNMVPAGSGKQATFVAVPGNPPKNVTGYPIVVSGVAQRVEKSGINLQQDKLPPMQGFELCHPNMATSSLPQSLPMGTIMVPAGGGVVAKPGSIADKAISTISDQQSLKKAVFHRVKGPDARQPGLQLTAAPQVMVSSVLTPQMSNLNISSATSQQSQKLVIEEKSIGKRDQNAQTAETTEKSQQAPTITTMGQSKSYKVTSNKTATELQKVVRFISADQSRQSLHEKMNSSQDESLSDVQRTDDSEHEMSSTASEIFGISKQKVVIHMDLELPEKMFSSDDDDEDDLPADNIVALMQDICPSSDFVKVDKKPQVPVTANYSSDTGIDEAVDISDDNIVAAVHDICPSEGSVEGGMKFDITLTAGLSEDNKTATAHFVGVADDVPLEKLNPYTLRGIIPRSQQPGLVVVTVNTQAGQLPGMTHFTYEDEKRKLVKLLVKDSKEQSQFFAIWSEEVGSINQSDGNNGTRNTPGVSGLIQTKQAQIVEVLQLLVYTGAQTDTRQIIQVIFSTSAGKIIFDTYRNRAPLPEDVARANGHHDLAQYLQDVNIRLSKECSSDVQSNTIDWLELVKAVDEIQKQSSVTEDETDFNSGQSEDDGNESDYFGDDETSSCGSFELEVGWEEDGEVEDWEGTCTTKDGGFKKEPSEGEDASIEVPPEMGTQFDENLEMAKGDESYEEPSIIDSKQCLSLNCLCEDLLLNAGDDTTTRQQGVGEPIEGEDASIKVPTEMGMQFGENLEMIQGDESCKKPSITVLLSAGDDTTASEQGVGVEETQEMGSFTQRIGGRTPKIDDANTEQQEANACPSHKITAKPKISESDVEPKVAAPGQAANEKLKKKVEKEQSLPSLSGERRQAVSNESLDHLAGVLKVTESWPVLPKGAERNLPNEAQDVIRGLQELLPTGRSRGLIVVSRSSAWLTNGGSVARPGGFICDLLVVGRDVGGLLLLTLCKPRSEEDINGYSLASAQALKKSLVLEGDCNEKFYISNFMVPCCATTVTDGLCCVDERYPNQYGLGYSREKLNKILEALVVILTKVPSALSTSLGVTFSNHLTKKQFQLLNEKIERDRELWVIGVAGTGKTLVAVEFMKKLPFGDEHLKKHEILCVCENDGLRKQIERADVCRNVCRKSFMDSREDFSNVKHVIMDEVQNFSDEDGNWLEKARSLVKAPSVDSKIVPGYPPALDDDPSPHPDINFLEGVLDNLFQEGYVKGDIAVLYEDEDDIPRNLESHLNISEISGATENHSECLVVSTVRKYSGLERPVVVFFKSLRPGTRQTFYCGVTRAMVKLVLIASTERSCS